jgi:hypothetical protein
LIVGGRAGTTGHRQTDLKTTQASLDQARRRSSGKDQLGYTELRADHKAVVTAWNAEAGQVVTAGQQVVTLAQPDIKEAVIDLPDTWSIRSPPMWCFWWPGNSTRASTPPRPCARSNPRPKRHAHPPRAADPGQHPGGFRLGTAISVTLSSAIKPRIELPATALQEADGKTRIWVSTPAAKPCSPVTSA